MRMPFRSRRSSLFAAGLLLLSGLDATAHEIKEMTARARVFADRVELIITVSTHMATVLLASPDAAELAPETLPRFRERLEAVARAFCSIRGGKTDLASTSLDVVMSSGEELTFFVTYPAPSASALRFQLGVLDRLETGNVVTLVVFDAARKPIAGKMLKRDDAILEVPPGTPPAATPIPSPANAKN